MKKPMMPELDRREIEQAVSSIRVSLDTLLEEITWQDREEDALESIDRARSYLTYIEQLLNEHSKP